ncbi:hypothetical protein H0H81_002980 [Sphagnurus paluster]|uniref:Alcohol acetyltransferase n=1 Tax=Sphagnurus paluster TaxID=117069 RepID=A0A9P7KGI6_9AGAR|nr:hypothetical protein H0H81_002980 [Sphagnurus paluster]
MDTCVVVAARLIPPQGRLLNQPTLFHALRKVVQSHAALGVRLCDESSNPSFERLHKIDLTEVVEFSEISDLEAALEALMQRPFDTTSDMPLWRVVALKDNTICFAWHHALGDGMSGLAFHRALLDSIKELGNYDPVADWTVIPSKGYFAPPIEAVLDLTPSWRKVVLEVFRLFAPTSWTRGASAWTGNPVKMHPCITTHARLIEFSPDTILELLPICRSHNATLTSTFHELAISTISSLILAEKQHERYKTISSYVPISLREVAGTSKDVFCDHVSILHTYPLLKTTFSWEEAARYAKLLRSYIPKSGEEIGMLKFLFGKYEAFFKGKLGKKRLGGPALKMNMVGDPTGGITITFTWGDDSLPCSFVEEFICDFRDGVEELLNSEATV